MLQGYKKIFEIQTLINYIFVLLIFIFPISAKKIYPLLLLLIVLWIIEGRWKEKFSILKASKGFIYYFIFMVFMGCSLFWSDSIYGGFTKHYPSNGVLEYFKMYFSIFLLVPIILTSIKSYYIKLSISIFLTSIFISEIISWGLFFEWLHIDGKIASDPSPFMHHSLYSIFLAITFFIVLTKFFQTKNKSYKFILILFATSNLANLFFNGGRLGQIAFLLGFFVYMIMRFKVSIKSVLIICFMLFGIVLTAYKVSPIFYKKVHQTEIAIQKLKQGNFNTSWGQRVYGLMVAKDVLKEHPFLGAGIGNAKNEFMEKSKQYSHGNIVKYFWHMHNQYMQVLIETGIIGFILFLVFIYHLFKIKIHATMYILFCTILTIYCFGFVGEPLFWNRQPFLLFNFLIGIFLWLDYIKIKEDIYETI